MLLVVLALAIVVAAVLLLGGGAALGEDGRRPGRLGSIVPALGLLGGVAVVGVLAIAALAVFGVRGGGSDDGPGPSAAPGTPGPPETPRVPGSTTTVPVPTGAPPADSSVRGPDQGPEVRLSPQAEDEFVETARVVDGLAGASVLRVTATGFVPDSTGEVRQCTGSATGPVRCRDRFPVRFDGTGAARFQYLVSPDRACGRGAECLLRLRGADDRTAVVPLVFGARVPTVPTLAVTPQRGLEDGEVVQVSVSGLAPRSRAQVVQCVPPGLPVAERCGAPGPVVPLVAGADGRGSATFTVSVGEVGSGRHPCRRGSRCGVALVSDGALVRAPIVAVGFSAGAGASYDVDRMALGFGAAALLLALAAWLIRTTDWREPSEASTPAMDAATLVEPSEV